MSTEQSSSFTMSESATENQFDASSTPKGTSYSLHGNMIVFWMHYDIDGEPCVPFEIGSTMYILKVDTMQGERIYEWETQLNSITPLLDLIKMNKWVVDEMGGAIARTFKPFEGESECEQLACAVRYY